MSKTVEAAGAVVYRWKASKTKPSKQAQTKQKRQESSAGQASNTGHMDLENIQLCIVHRPKYDDWSWPKGKMEARESHAQTAVREVSEETGLVIRLGPYLGDIEYPLADEGKRKHSRKGPRKHICYWMADLAQPEMSDRLKAIIGRVPSPDPEEVDQIEWVGVKAARTQLTHASDRQILDAFVDRVEEGALQASTILIVRHGKSIARKEWSGDDAQRPLTPRGAAAAYALNRQFACWAPDYLFSSPWTRCLQTVRPYAAETEQHIEKIDCLTETAFAEKPALAYAWLDALIADCIRSQTTKLVCMHRPVLGGVFEHLRSLCPSTSLTHLLPTRTPYMPTGTALAIHMVDTGQGPSIIDIQKVSPIVY